MRTHTHTRAHITTLFTKKNTVLVFFILFLPLILSMYLSIFLLCCACVCLLGSFLAFSSLLSSSSFHVSIRVDRTQYCYSHYSCNIFRTVETVNLYRRIFFGRFRCFFGRCFLGVLCNFNSIRVLFRLRFMWRWMTLFFFSSSTLNVQLMCEFLSCAL